jgi:hypothetical protein
MLCDDTQLKRTVLKGAEKLSKRLGLNQVESAGFTGRFMSHVLPWLRRPPSSQDATPPPQASVKSEQPFALHPELPPTTAALYGTYAAVLATIVFLSWSINRKLKRRSRSQAEPWLIAQSPTRLTHTRSNFADLNTSPQDATPSQRAEYAEMCAAMVQDAHDFVAPDGGARKIVWERKPDVEGAAVYLAHVPESPIVLIKGVLTIRVPNIEKLASYFAELDTTDKMKHSLTKLDPMFINGRVIYRMAQKRWPVGSPIEKGTVPVVADDPHSKTQVEWACFAAPPLASRDFCWLEHSTFAKAPEDGRQMFLSLCTSVEREEAPDLWATHGFVRGQLTSTGYIFKATDEPDVWELSYVVQARAPRTQGGGRAPTRAAGARGRSGRVRCAQPIVWPRANRPRSLRSAALSSALSPQTPLVPGPPLPPSACRLIPRASCRRGLSTWSPPTRPPTPRACATRSPSASPPRRRCTRTTTAGRSCRCRRRSCCATAARPRSRSAGSTPGRRCSGAGCPARRRASRTPP